MADEQSTETTDTSVSEDTSTNEDSQDTDDRDLEEIEVSIEDIESDETEDTEESTDEAAATDSTDETEEESEAGVEEESPEEATKRHNAEMAQKRIADREAKDNSKAEAQQEYLDGAEDNRDLALRQLQIDAYNNRVEGNNNKLQNGIDKAVASIDLFQTGTPEIKEELANSLDDFERMYVKRDGNGDPIEVKGDVHQYLQAKADSIRRLTGVGARQQGKDKSNQKNRTLSPPVKTPQKPKADPLMEAFDEEAKKY